MPTSSDSTPLHNIENLALARFDEMVHTRKIFYEPTTPIRHHDRGFDFEFRIITMLTQKPVLAADAPGRTQATGPFIHPDPDEVVTTLNAGSHRLLLNKFSFYRPMLLITTTAYEPQSNNLTLSDFHATWPVLIAYKTRMIVIYNCGVNSGSSQGHKHLQLFPYPSHTLWPDTAAVAAEVQDGIPHVPFKHFVRRLEEGVGVESVFECYVGLLERAREVLRASGSASRDYNVVLTAEWVAVVPRRTAGPGGPFGGNAMGMLGLVTVRSEKEWAEWVRLGYGDYLCELGVPV